MKHGIALGLGMMLGVVVGAVTVGGLNAQNAVPGAYAIIDISEIGDPALFKTLLPKAESSLAAAGGKLIARTESIVGLDGAPPKRFIVLGFDSMDKAKAWAASSAQKEVDDVRKKSSKSREFIVDGKIE
jgi:uncharacterized protein (DUF1330 family)